MSRTLKYSTAQEAAERNLYSKMAGPSMGLSLREFINKATHKCELCGCEPGNTLDVVRTDDSYSLDWNYIVFMSGRYVTLCKVCKSLARNFNLPEILSHCARIMAKRKWNKTLGWFLLSQDKRFPERSKPTPASGMPK